MYELSKLQFILVVVQHILKSDKLLKTLSDRKSDGERSVQPSSSPFDLWSHWILKGSKLRGTEGL